MRLAVRGAGGLGGYFGARLCRGSAEVHFIARGAHLEAIQRDGLRIEGPDQFHIAGVSATDDPREIGAVDVVLLCVKLWDTDAALQQIRPLIGPNTTILSFQNGVLKDQDLQEVFGPSRIMGDVSYIAATIERPGVIRRTGPMQKLVFGEFDGSRSSRGKALLQACLAGGIDAELSGDILRDTWRKFVFLVGLSGTTTTIRKPIGAIRGNPQTRAFLLDVMREVVAVGRAHGVDLAEHDAEAALKQLDAIAADITASMHHDLERGHPLEIRWLSGGVVALGQRHRVPAPLNRAIADILTLHAAGTPPPASHP